MKLQYTLLQKEVSPATTSLFKETENNNPRIISDGKEFSIIITDWESGSYILKSKEVEITSESFKPLKTIEDLNNIWKSLVGMELTHNGRYIEKVEIGKIYPTKRNGNMKVIEIISNRESKVQFENGYTKISQNSNILRGGVKNLYYPSVYGVGYFGEGKYSSTNTPEIYDRWRRMLQRCYDEKVRYMYKSYTDIVVCEEWKSLQNFGEWHDQNWKPYMKGWDLDKDFLSESDKIYSPDSCCFIPTVINNIFINSGKKVSELPIGVIKQGKKYFATLSKGEETFKSDLKDTPEEAFKVYKYEKEKYAKELAEEYKDLVDMRVCNRLINFEALSHI